MPCSRHRLVYSVSNVNGPYEDSNGDDVLDFDYDGESYTGPYATDHIVDETPTDYVNFLMIYASVIGRYKTSAGASLPAASQAIDGDMYFSVEENYVHYAVVTDVTGTSVDLETDAGPSVTVNWSDPCHVFTNHVDTIGGGNDPSPAPPQVNDEGWVILGPHVKLSGQMTEAEWTSGSKWPDNASASTYLPTAIQVECTERRDRSTKRPPMFKATFVDGEGQPRVLANSEGTERFPFRQLESQIQLPARRTAENLGKRHAGHLDSAFRWRHHPKGALRRVGAVLAPVKITADFCAKNLITGDEFPGA